MIYVDIYDVLLCYILFTLSLPAHSLIKSYLSLATELQRNAKRQTACLISRANNCTLSTGRLQAIAGCGIMRAMGQTAIVTVHSIVGAHKSKPIWDNLISQLESIQSD